MYGKTDYRGIDYGLGRSNICPKTGLRFGVIPANDVGQIWWDEAEPEYLFMCPRCEKDCTEKEMCTGCCPNCGYEFQDDEFDIVNPIGWYYIKEGYHLYQASDDPDIFITNSPYYTYAQYCSPCAPGAIYLPSPLTEKPEMNKGYCLGPDWFEDNIPPYDVYSIKTGKLIQRAG